MNINSLHSNMAKTLICVEIAGILFITAVIYRVWWLFIIAAFFDWLPLPTGWMKIGGRSRKVKKYGALHGIVTLIAYAIGIIWIFKPQINGVSMGHLFLTVWFTAVLLGAYVTEIALMEKQ